MFNRFHDFLVSRAATKVPRKGLPDLLPGGVRVPVEKRLRGEYHTRGAETALDRSAFVKRHLDGMKLTPLGQPLNGCDMSIFDADRQGKTGQNGPPVEEDRTTAALTLVAALLGPRKSQTIPENLKQGFPIMDTHLR